MEITMLKIRRPLGRLIFNMGIAIPGKTVFLIETVQGGMAYYAVNWCVSRWNGRDTMDMINFFTTRPGGLTHEKVQISWNNYFFLT